MELVCAKAKQVKAMAGLSNTSSLFETTALNLDDFFRPTALFNALRQFTGRQILLDPSQDKLISFPGNSRRT